MISKTEADVVIAGTGIVGCLIAEQMLDAGVNCDGFHSGSFSLTIFTRRWQFVTDILSTPIVACAAARASRVTRFTIN